MAQKERAHFGSKLGIILDSGLLLIFITTPNVFDFVTGQIFLPIGGILTCLFLGRYIPKQVMKDEFTNWGTAGLSLFGAFFHSFVTSVRFVSWSFSYTNSMSFSAKKEPFHRIIYQYKTYAF